MKQNYFLEKYTRKTFLDVNKCRCYKIQTMTKILKIISEFPEVAGRNLNEENILNEY